jgi:hypothetical protein
MSTSQGRYLHTGQQKHKINEYTHPCLEWDSNPRSQRRVSEDISCLRPRRHLDSADILEIIISLNMQAVIMERHGKIAIFIYT